MYANIKSRPDRSSRPVYQAGPKQKAKTLLSVVGHVHDGRRRAFEYWIQSIQAMSISDKQANESRYMWARVHIDIWPGYWYICIWLIWHSRWARWPLSPPSPTTVHFEQHIKKWEWVPVESCQWLFRFTCRTAAMSAEWPPPTKSHSTTIGPPIQNCTL